ncbi:ATP-binding protein [Actinomadura fibrosa]|uniref:ATP-binding protein n=1 Tax=Actinomadura fibrosa TaxID=111802 RepID=A0ABW2XC37_9ACTN|nr:ATP-binding protein [Actinomadura fibrosa]
MPDLHRGEQRTPDPSNAASPMALAAGDVPMLVLGCTDQAPRLARRFLAARFREWGIVDDYIGRLVVCELVTNAYRHGAGPIVVRLSLDEGQPCVEVWDAGENHPVVRPQNCAATSGRGLHMLAEIVSGRWGVRPLNGGKAVWAKLPTP